MNKPLLRQKYIQTRNQLSIERVNLWSNQIFQNLPNIPIWDFQNFHLFQSIPGKNEVQTKGILVYLNQLGKTILVPKVEGKTMLTCKINSSTTWISGAFQVPEPSNCLLFPETSIEVIFVPLLICDQKGNRIGYGGGFYDRFLSKCSPNALKIGLSFFSPIKEIIDAEDFDIPLDYCVTPTEIVSFKTV